MKRVSLLAMAALFLAGCTFLWREMPRGSDTEPPPLRTALPVGPATEQPAKRTMTDYAYADLGVRFSYPAMFPAPAVDSLGGLVLRWDQGDLMLQREERNMEADLAQLGAEFAVTNIKASGGRFFVETQAVRELAGRDAAYLKAHFSSAAGRWDRVYYIVQAGPWQYRVSCGTQTDRPGPPVATWEDVRPVCEQILGSLRLDSEGK